MSKLSNMVEIEKSVGNPVVAVLATTGLLITGLALFVRSKNK